MTPPRIHWIGPESHGFGQGHEFKLARGVCIGNAHPCTNDYKQCTPPYTSVGLWSDPVGGQQRRAEALRRHPPRILTLTKHHLKKARKKSFPSLDNTKKEAEPIFPEHKTTKCRGCDDARL